MNHVAPVLYNTSIFKFKLMLERAERTTSCSVYLRILFTAIYIRNGIVCNPPVLYCIKGQEQKNIFEGIVD